MSVDHYENFPVASVLCPPALRPAVAAIYWYARTADDLADEGQRSNADRLADLAAYREDLQRCFAGEPPSPRWAGVFTRLDEARRQFALPIGPLEDLLSAFEQDVTKQSYADAHDLLDYCRRSANPIGRLLLHLYAVDDTASLARSDAICSALQLINFWQDLSVDLPRGRVYIPLDACARHRVPVATLLAREEARGTQSLLREMSGWAESLMLQGEPLVEQLPGRIGLELRLIVQGGLRILEKIARSGHTNLHHRPVLRAWDGPVLLWRGWRRWRPAHPLHDLA